MKLEDKKTSHVKIDVIASSTKTKTVICFEMKGGKNAEVEQFIKYKAITLDDLKLLIAIDNPIDVEICYVVMSENMEKILSILKPNVKRPIILLDVSKDNKNYGFQTLGGKTNISHLLPSKVSYMLNKIPFVFYPFSSDDDLDWIMPKVIQAFMEIIMNKMTEEEEKITVTAKDILEKTFRKKS